MRKEALIVGVSDCNGTVSHLEAVLPEVQNWKDLLERRYGFTVRTLEENKASPAAVLKEFGELLEGAKVDDQLIFLPICHGTLYRARDGRQEHTFLVWPPDGKIESAMVGFSDFARVLNEKRPPVGTDLAIIMESCHAGAYGSGPAADSSVKSLFVSPPGRGNVDVAGMTDRFGATKIALRSIRGFGDPMVASADSWALIAEERSMHPGHAHGARTTAVKGTRPSTAGIEEPLIVAATGRFQSAYQVPGPDGEPRMLFSMCAIKRLWQKGSVTFRTFIEEIKPLRDHWAQVPELRGGNGARYEELFPGVPARPTNALAKPDADEAPVAPKNPAEAPLSDETVRGGSMYALNVKIAGICCLVDVYGGTKRLVIPYDDANMHIPFIEIAHDDIDVTHTQGEQPSKKNYVHISPPMNPGNVTYDRWELRRRYVVIDNVANDPLVVTPAYDQYVPQMKKVLPELDAFPADDCFKRSPQQKAQAYFDIAHGELGVGALGERLIQFNPEKDWPASRSPEWLYLHVPLLSESAVISIWDFHASDQDVVGSRAATITLQPWAASVTLGHQMEIDLEGPGSPDVHPEHFLMYYTLARTDPNEHPMPVDVGAPLHSCSPTDWP